LVLQFCLIVRRQHDNDRLRPTCLSLQFGEMQGDVDEMQGGGKDKPAKCRQISIVWMGLSLLREQGRFGRSREVSVRIAVDVQEQPQSIRAGDD
jgi:hypothetical protein